MTGRRWLQVALAGLGVVVTALVVLNWSEGTGRRPEEDPDIGPPDVEGKLVSRSEHLRLRKSDRSGAQSYYVQADTLRSYEGGRQEWVGNVRLRLYSAPQGEEMRQEMTELTAERLEQHGPTGEPNQIHLRDDVRIELPGGARIDTQWVRYGAADEQVYTDAGVELEYAGLSFRARHLRYDRLAGRLELWGDPTDRRTGRLSIESAPREGGEAGPEIRGGARSLVLEGEQETLRLEGLPDVELAGAAVAGNVLVLEFAEEELESLQAEGEGAAVWSRGGSEHVLRAGLVVVELAGGEPSVVRGCRRAGPHAGNPDSPAPRCGDTGPGRPLLALAGGGSLRGDRIDLFTRPEGAGVVVADGDVSLDGRDAGLGLDRLDAGSLRLQLGGAGIEGAEASGGVELETDDPETAGRLTGERLSLGWEQEGLSHGTWPEGVHAELADTCAVAGRGSYLPDDRAWSLQESPPASTRCGDAPSDRPLLTHERYSVMADAVTLGLDGRLEADGDLDVSLRGESLAAVGAVFGTEDRVDGTAGSLVAEGGRLELEEDVSLWQGRQLVQAGTVILDLEQGGMTAMGGVQVVLERGEQTVDLSGERMLVGPETSELRLAGDVLLSDGGRRLTGSNMVVGLGESGLESVEMRGGVEMEDPDGRAQGQELIWDFETGTVTVFGGQGRPATFRSPQGMQNQDPEALEFRWNEGGLTIRALQKGTVQTLRSKGSASVVFRSSEGRAGRSFYR